MAQRSEAGGILRAFGTTLLVLCLLGAVGVVLYLLSDINHRRYRVAPLNGQLVVERGLMLPAGFGPYEAESAALRDVYAPLPLPPNDALGFPGVYEERADVDRALFAALSGWARPKLEAMEPASVDLAAAYVRRLEVLPALSEDQRLQLRTLRANLAFRDGAHTLESILEQLQHAQEAFRLALQLGTPHASAAQQWIDEIERRIKMYRDVPLPRLPAAQKAQ